MTLHIEQEQTADVAVLRCAGSMVRTEALSVLKKAVTSLSDARVVVLDLSDVPMVGARGLGMLVFLHKWADTHGIQLKLVNPSLMVRQVLEVTGLTSVLRISSVSDLVEMFCNADRAVEYVQSAAA
jgi:anti-anti-sigma factor